MTLLFTKNNVELIWNFHHLSFFEKKIHFCLILIKNYFDAFDNEALMNYINDFLVTSKQILSSEIKAKHSVNKYERNS